VAVTFVTACIHHSHESREITIAPRPEQEVEMIGHHAIGQQPHDVPGHSVSQDPFERSEIPVVLEDGEPGDGTVKRVVD
jgi:hypothetical protein